MSAASTLQPIRNSRPALILLIGVAVGNLPLFAQHLLNMWKQPQYQYFPIVLAVIGWLVWRGVAWREEPLESRWSFPWGVSAITASLAAAIYATLLMSPWVATLSLVLGFGGLLLVLRNWLSIENSFGIWCLSLLVLRPPIGLDARLSFWLQGVTSRVSGAMLDMVGVVNLVEGNTIVLQDRHLFIEEACSGIVSLMSIIACCAIIAVWQNRPAPHAILLTVSGAIWAGILNVFRITIMAIALDIFRIDMTEGWRHEALGLVLFAGTLGLSFCTDRFLLFMLTPISPPDAALYGSYTAEQRQHPLSRLWNVIVQPGLFIFGQQPHLDLDDEEYEDGYEQPAAAPTPRLQIPAWTIAFGTLFLAIGVTQIVRGALSGDNFERVEPKAAILGLTMDSMPASFEGYSRDKFSTQSRKVDDILGERSHQWQYIGPGHLLLFSMDFVFLEFHELTVCYEGTGWKLVSRRVFPRENSDQQFVVAEFSKDTGEHAYLVFGSFDQVGTNVAPPDASLVDGFRARVFKAGKGVPGGVYQCQALVQTSAALPETDRENVLRAYFGFYDRMAQTAKAE